MRCATCNLEISGPYWNGGEVTCLPPGTRVRLKPEFVELMLQEADMSDHIEEFKDCEGVVVGHAEIDWPEVDVEWEIYETTLRYCYQARDLEVITIHSSDT